MMVHMAFKVRCYCGEVGKRGRHDGPQWPSRCVTTVERWGRGADMMVHVAFKVRCYCEEVGKRGWHDGPRGL